MMLRTTPVYSVSCTNLFIEPSQKCTKIIGFTAQNKTDSQPIILTVVSIMITPKLLLKHLGALKISYSLIEKTTFCINSICLKSNRLSRNGNFLQRNLRNQDFPKASMISSLFFLLKHR